MANQTKISFLYLLAAVLLLCEVTLPQVSAARYHYRGSAATRRNRLRRKECKDEEKAHATCVKLVKELGFKVCYTQIVQLRAKLERSCAETCKFCGKPPIPCRTSEYGCCWDAHTPGGDIYGIKGCPECKDHLRICNRFRKFCANKDKTGNGAFMELHCPMTCRKCLKKRMVKIQGQKIKMRDWSKI